MIEDWNGQGKSGKWERGMSGGKSGNFDRCSYVNILLLLRLNLMISVSAAMLLTNFSMMHQPKSVSKMADYKTLSLCISLNSNKMCTYIWKDLVTVYCLCLAKIRFLNSVNRFQIDSITHTLLLLAWCHMKCVHIKKSWKIFWGQGEVREDGSRRKAATLRYCVSFYLSEKLLHSIINWLSSVAVK